jgi:hypothetical protein
LQVAKIIEVSEPGMAESRMEAAILEVKRTGLLIYQVDRTLALWIKQLNRAQPWRPFRLSIIFSRSEGSMIEGALRYDVVPVVGRMIQLKNGTWKFYRLRGAMKSMRLTDLRVGKGLTGDSVVIRILEEIERLLEQRDQLVETLIGPRRGAPGKRASIEAKLTRSADMAIDLAERVKLDWEADRDGAEKALRSTRQEKYLKQKALKAAQQSQGSGVDAK